MASSFLFPCGCFAAAVVPVSVIERKLFFYLSLQCNLSLLIHFILASIALSFDLLLPSCVASPVLYMPSVPEGVHHHVLLPVCLVWMCTLVCSLNYWWHSCLPSFLQFPGPCFLYGCYGIASWWYINMGQAYIWFTPCTGVFITLCIVPSATALPHLCSEMLLMLYKWWGCKLSLQSSSGGNLSSPCRILRASQFMPCLTCNNLAPRLILYALVSRYSCIGVS